LPRRATIIFRAALVGSGLLAGSTALAVLQYYHSPYWHRVGLAPDQPVLFSHRHHAGQLGIDCRFCHATVETSAFAGLPATQTCLNCHSQLFTDTPLLAPVIHSATSGEPLVWTRVTRLPDHVYFDHSIHVAKGVSCTTCHGDVARMALTAKAQPLDMRECLACHRAPAAYLSEGVEKRRARPLGALENVRPPEVMRGGPSGSAPSRAGAFDALAASAGEIGARPLTNCSTCHH